jgi:hypothetical protein
MTSRGIRGPAERFPLFKEGADRSLLRGLGRPSIILYTVEGYNGCAVEVHDRQDSGVGRCIAV